MQVYEYRIFGLQKLPYSTTFRCISYGGAVVLHWMKPSPCIFLMYFFKVFCKYHLKLCHAILVLGCIFCHVYVFVKFTTTDIKLHFALWACARREKKRLFLDENLEEKELRSVSKKIVHIIPSQHHCTEKIIQKSHFSWSLVSK